jgi:hypothetical protein
LLAAQNKAQDERNLVVSIHVLNDFGAEAKP